MIPAEPSGLLLLVLHLSVSPSVSGGPPRGRCGCCPLPHLFRRREPGWWWWCIALFLLRRLGLMLGGLSPDHHSPPPDRGHGNVSPFSGVAAAAGLVMLFVRLLRTPRVMTRTLVASTTSRVRSLVEQERRLKNAIIPLRKRPMLLLFFFWSPGYCCRNGVF